MPDRALHFAKNRRIRRSRHGTKNLPFRDEEQTLRIRTCPPLQLALAAPLPFRLPHSLVPSRGVTHDRAHGGLNRTSRSAGPGVNRLLNRVRAGSKIGLTGQEINLELSHTAPRSRLKTCFPVWSSILDQTAARRSARHSIRARPSPATPYKI